MLEIVITVAIMAILASIGSAYYVGFYRRNQLDFETKKTVAALRDARNRAVSQEQASNWGVRFSNQVTNPDYYQIFYGSSYAGGTVVSTNYYPGSLQLNDPGSGLDRDVIFTQLTGLPNASTTVNISLANNIAASSTITVNTNGQIIY